MASPVCPQPEMMKKTAESLRRLGLSRETGINLSSGKSFSWGVPANVVALRLFRLAQRLRVAPLRRLDAWPIEKDMGPFVECQIGCRPDGTHIMDPVASGDTAPDRAEIAEYQKQLEQLEDWGQRGAGKQLPPLSKETAAQWATATRELFRICYGQKFEEHPNLQELRKAVLPRSKDAYGKRGGAGTVRKLILQALKQAWQSIAAVRLNKV